MTKLLSSTLRFRAIFYRFSTTSKHCDPFAPTDQTDLKGVLAKKITSHQNTVASFRKQHGHTVVQNITIDMIYGGMRGMRSMIWETSTVDPEEGIRFRGYSLSECKNLFPKPVGREPSPEAVWWLLCSGDIPTAQQIQAVSKEWAKRAALPDHVESTLSKFPTNVHPMSTFVAAIAAMNSDSKFSDAYRRQVPPLTYWEYVYEDCMNLLATLPSIAATIYANLYRDGTSVVPPDFNKDWSENFATMLGYESPEFVDLLRLYLFLHCDHEGGNVSAHTCHLVASALTDPYLSFAAAMCGLAGPLHGGASQVVPGYGHGVLRKTDPRYDCFRQFALEHLPDDPMFKLVSDLHQLVPSILQEHGKAKNPWPNLDAHSGVLLQHYNMKEMDFYPVLIGVSRAIGCLAHLIWDRALGFPIERPKSFATSDLMELAVKR